MSWGKFINQGNYCIKVGYSYEFSLIQRTSESESESDSDKKSESESESDSESVSDAESEEFRAKCDLNQSLNQY